jgi:uncharacterized protein (DUF1684 family)
MGFRRWAILGVVSVAMSATAMMADPWVLAQQQWRQQRASVLTEPDGWLSLVGLHWLMPGRQAVGRTVDADIRLRAGPDLLGEFELREVDGAQQVVWFPPSSRESLHFNDADVSSDAIVLGSDTSEKPSWISWSDGSVQLIERGGKLGLRVRDSSAQTRRDFQGLAWFDPVQDWQVSARFEPKPDGSTIPIANVLGQLEDTPNPGTVIFEKEGASYTLEALGDPAESLFLIVADRSNGKQTYGAGRFLYTEAVVDGEVVLDFNRMVNPPCAYNAYSTCPLPPPENRLDLTVQAGEKTYPGAH